MSDIHKKDLLGLFAHHKVAANLTMILMILAGIWALTKLNTQFFPTFSLDIITVRVAWSGASAEDVETAIVIPMEQELRTADELRKLTSTSAEGIASLSLEYEEGADMDRALEQVKERVALLRNLPSDAEEPEITRVVRYEPVGKLLVTGPSDPAELRHLVRRMERELLGRGIAKIDITGLPEEEIAIQVPSSRLQELGLTLEQVAERVAELSRDFPAGIVGRDEAGRQLRSLDQRRSEQGYARLPLVADDGGRLVTLGDVADIERRPQDREVQVRYQQRPAVELQLYRAENGDSLRSAQVLESWLQETRLRLPPGVEVHVFDESWQLIKERISLLVKNGLGGLLLVMAILFLFLNGRVAWWVTVGIPVSFMATLAILYLSGGSINMISLFALIMALGIIVDDAIVVGEDALAHYQRGEPALTAAEGGARRMLAPVMASSLTTVAAFLPLMLVGGVIGNIMFAIPLVIVCVIIASLIESFFVLPGHLRHAFQGLHHRPPTPFRQRWDSAFERFREGRFRRIATLAVEYRASTLAAAVALLLLVAGLVFSGRVGFHFFPSPEGTVLFANVAFAAGTPKKEVDDFLVHVEQALNKTNAAYGEDVVRTYVVYRGRGTATGGGFARGGDRLGSVLVELTSPDSRTISNQAFAAAWRERVRHAAGLENFTISARQAGPPGQDVDVRITGDNPQRVKAAALELAEALKGVAGVSALEDDMAYGQTQLVYRLTPTGQALGLTTAAVGRQLQAAFDGRLAQIFQDGVEEVEVRVVLPDAERNSLAALQRLNMTLPSGEKVPLSTVVSLQPRQGFEVLRHDQGKLAVHVTGELDTQVNSTDAVLSGLEERVLPALRARYGVETSFGGRAEEQAETLGDMRRGLIFGLALIYVILTWVFASYGWPLVVMAAIPFGLVGAVVGHWVMSIDLTVLSLFGLFGLSGIAINDSIILVTFYKHLREQGMAIKEAIIEASCQRLRAVLLTSLTTIGGLTPLLFETSLQAQFLIPMAVTISFGLAFSTLLVLLVIPSLLSFHESIAERWGRRAAPRAATEIAT